MESIGLFEQFLKSNSEKLSTDVYTDFLYLDFNGIVRSVVFPKNKNFVNVTDEEEIFQKIFSKIYKIARITIARIIFIAFDGVPKDTTQIRENEKKEEAPTEGITWTAILPGTPFMERLYIRMKNFDWKSWGVEEVEISPSTDPGKGEDKIFKHLKSMCSAKPDAKYMRHTIVFKDDDVITERKELDEFDVRIFSFKKSSGK